MIISLPEDNVLVVVVIVAEIIVARKIIIAGENDAWRSWRLIRNNQSWSKRLRWRIIAVIAVEWILARRRIVLTRSSIIIWIVNVLVRSDTLCVQKIAELPLHRRHGAVDVAKFGDIITKRFVGRVHIRTRSGKLKRRSNGIVWIVGGTPSGSNFIWFGRWKFFTVGNLEIRMWRIVLLVRLWLKCWVEFGFLWCKWHATATTLNILIAARRRRRSRGSRRKRFGHRQRCLIRCSKWRL